MRTEVEIAKTCNLILGLFETANMEIIKHLFAKNLEETDPNALILVVSGTSDYGFSDNSDIIFTFLGNGDLVNITERIDISKITSVKDIAEYKRISQIVKSMYKDSLYTKCTVSNVGSQYIDINFCKMSWYNVIMGLVQDKAYNSIEEAMIAANNGEQIL